MACGLLADRALGEPPARAHPVVGFAALMTRIESAVYADRRGPGALYAATGVALGVAAGTGVRSTTVATALSAAGRELRREARRVHRALRRGDLDAARAALPALVGRDVSTLDESGAAAAVIESLADNTVDAVVAPALWAVVAGAPGALGYRAVNTMDAMIGHRSARYARFGWAAARLDDLAGWVPARATAALVAAVRPGCTRRIAASVRHDAPRHPSPNAGVAETAFAAALGVTLGGPLRYGDRREDRPHLGYGPRPRTADVARAILLADHVERALLALLLVPTAWRVATRTRGPR